MLRCSVWSEIYCLQHSILNLINNCFIILTENLLSWEPLSRSYDCQKIERKWEKVCMSFQTQLWWWDLRTGKAPKASPPWFQCKMFLKTDSLLLALTPGDAQCLALGLPRASCGDGTNPADPEDPWGPGPTEPKYSQQPDILSLPLKGALWGAFRLLKM